MSREVWLYIRTELRAAQAQASFVRRLRALGVDPELFAIEIEQSDQGDRDWGMDQHGFVSTLSAFVQPFREALDADMEVATLLFAQEAGADLVMTYAGEPMLAYHAGTAYLRTSDRAYFEEQVLPRFSGRVCWDVLLPWKAAPAAASPEGGV